MTLTDPFWLVLAIPLAMVAVAVAVAFASDVGPAMCGLGIAASGPVRFVRSAAGPIGHGRVGGRSQPLDAAGQRRRCKKKRPTSFIRPCTPAIRLAVVSFAETAAVEQSPAVGQVRRLLGRGGPRGVATWPMRSTWRFRWSTATIPAASWSFPTAAGPAATSLRRPPRRPRPAWPSITGPIERPGGRRSGHRAALQGPESVMPGESFMITAWLDSPLGPTGLLRIAARLGKSSPGARKPFPRAPAG